MVYPPLFHINIGVSYNWEPCIRAVYKDAWYIILANVEYQ